MIITFVMKESEYDCNIQITDSKGSRYYYISALEDKESSPAFTTAEVFDSDFILNLVPVMPDMKSADNESESNSWKDKLANKAAELAVSSLEKMILRVGCSYRVSGVRDGDRLDITLQNYVFGASELFDLLGLVPVMYAFFEVSCFNCRYRLADAFGINRKDFIKSARALSLAYGAGNGCLGLLISYPIQVKRVKYLTRDKKVSKVLKKFNSMSDAERQCFLAKQERLF